MSERDAMKLPSGKTCSDCANYARCNSLLGGRIDTWTSCDWFPSRFVDDAEQRAKAFAIVERELREHELSVCQYNDDDHGYSSVWEGEMQDGWSLLQAVDQLRKETP